MFDGLPSANELPGQAGQASCRAGPSSLCYEGQAKLYLEKRDKLPKIAVKA
jgi:hypothetical protein